jgi:hypothetical protein
MAQGALVERQINDGLWLIQELRRDGFDVTAAFWTRESDEEQWALYIASTDVNNKGVTEAYRVIHEAFKGHPELWISPFDVRLLKTTSPMIRDVLAIRGPQPGIPTRFLGNDLGGARIDDAYIYGPFSGPAEEAVLDEKQLFDALSRKFSGAPRLADESPLRGGDTIPAFLALVQDKIDVVRGIRPALGRTPVKNPPRILVDIVDSLNADAWAAPEGDIYFLGFSVGILALPWLVFDVLFSSPDFLPEIGDVGEESRDRPSPEVTKNPADLFSWLMQRQLTPESLRPRNKVRRDLSSMMAGHALHFLAGHELRHVQGGHLDYMGGRRFSLDAILEVNSGRLPTDTAMTRQALEMDADAFSAGAIFWECLKQLKDPDPIKRPIMHHFVNSSRNLPYLLLLACCVIFRALDDTDPLKTKPWDEWPHPPLLLRRYMLGRPLFDALCASGLPSHIGDSLANALGQTYATLEPDLNRFFTFKFEPHHYDSLNKDLFDHMEKIVNIWNTIGYDVNDLGRKRFGLT